MGESWDPEDVMGSGPETVGAQNPMGVNRPTRAEWSGYP
jgi:hypothetical protein